MVVQCRLAVLLTMSQNLLSNLQRRQDEEMSSSPSSMAAHHVAGAIGVAAGLALLAGGAGHAERQAQRAGRIPGGAQALVPGGRACKAGRALTLQQAPLCIHKAVHKLSVIRQRGLLYVIAGNYKKHIRYMIGLWKQS
jgi:hypothetical protein